MIYPAFDEMAAVVFPDHDGPHRLDACGHFVPWEAPDALVAHTTGSAPTSSAALDGCVSRRTTPAG